MSPSAYPLGSDAALLAAVGRAEFLVKGFRNVDIRTILLGPDPDAPADRPRRSARICRMIGLLRAHGLVKKIPKTQRYLLTTLGQTCIPAILAARDASLQKLTAA